VRRVGAGAAVMALLVVLLAAGCAGDGLAGKAFIAQSSQQHASPSSASTGYAFGPSYLVFGQDKVQWYRDDVCFVEDYQVDAAGSITVSGAVVGEYDAVSGHLTWHGAQYVPK
jgi:hypothetical protein